MAETNDSVVLITCDGANMYTPFTKPVEDGVAIVLETPVLSGKVFKFWRIIHEDTSEETNTDNPLTVVVSESLEIRAVYGTDEIAYYMNFSSDTPQGSISGTISDGVGNLYEMGHIGEETKKLQGILAGFNYITVNGYNVQRYNTNDPYYGALRFTSIASDVLTGITDMTFIAAYKTGMPVYPQSGYYKMLFSHYNTDKAIWLCVYLSDVTGLMTAQMVPIDSNYCQAVTPERYDDDVWHIVAVTFNQTAKTVTIYMDDGTEVSNTNENYVAGSLTTNIAGNPQIGCWNNAPYSFIGQFGFTEHLPDIIPAIGDIMFLKGILTAEQINLKANWIANRLGITWTDI